MRLIQTNLMLGISSILLYPYIFVLRMDYIIINHAYIHVMQIRRSQRKYGKTKGVIIWYFSYLWEYVKTGFSYRKIKYEVEAFANEENEAYIQLRDPELFAEMKNNNVI